jgi:hypothetical protein
MVGDLCVSPIFPPRRTLCPASPSLRWVVWASLPHLLRYYARLRLPLAPLDGLCSRSTTDTLFVPSVRVLSSSSLALRNPCVNARPAWSPGTPFPGCLQGNKWLSQVPRLPLCQHAPLFDPGGVLNTRPIVPRTAAFHPFDGVGFPAILLTVILLSTIIQISRLNDAACFLAPPGFGRPLPALPAGFATALLARLWSDGIFTH